MNYLRTLLLLSLMYVASFSAMNIQLSASSAPQNTFFVPEDIWKHITHLCPRRNALKLVNKYLYALASWNNWKEIVKADFCCIDISDAHKLLFEAMDNGTLHENPYLLHLIRNLGIKNPTKITNLNIPIWFYARTEDTVHVLEKFGRHPGQP